MEETQENWKIAGLAILPIRFVQGWIFWGGGSRRFIYDPSKLDPHAHEWMANKLQSAMPGAILGVDRMISFTLQHFYLLYASVIIFSLVELISGLGLIFGFFTRASAFITVLISIVLMLAFGWQGGTCMDEWTMAVATFSMGMTLTLSGASIYSIDNIMMRTYPKLTTRRWLSLFASGPLTTFEELKKIALTFLVITVAFTLLTYNYYRGSILTPYHAGPVNPSKHHITLSDGILQRGVITLKMYVDAGTPAEPSNIIRIELLNDKNQIVEAWDGKTLSLLTSDKIQNEYAYNKISAGPNGIVAPMSAKATIKLSSVKLMKLSGNNYRLVIFTINGNRFETPLKMVNET